MTKSELQLPLCLIKMQNLDNISEYFLLQFTAVSGKLIQQPLILQQSLLLTSTTQNSVI